MRRGLLPLLIFLLVTTRAWALDLVGTRWEREAARYGIDPYLLYAFALCESGHYVGHGQVRPWPWALGIPGKSYYPETREEAEAILLSLLREGKRNIGVGLMQVNVKYHADEVEKVTDLLDPQINIRLGTRILYESLIRHPDSVLRGLGAYYSSSRPEKAIPYARRILSVARLLHKIRDQGGDRRVAER